MYNAFMKKAKYICLEGTEGVGKTTQTEKLVQYLKSKGFSVLQTKEPGTQHLPLTMLLRGIMLDNQYDEILTRPAREFISQAIRSIHLEKLISPALKEYDYIIQDRGILSGYAYGAACGNNYDDLRIMTINNIDSASEINPLFPIVPELIYDKVIYLRGNTFKGLERAKTSKKEFASGDAMESKGNFFLEEVSENMRKMSTRFNTLTIEIDGKSIDEVHLEILSKLEMEM
jgi:dTMP kinase